MENSVVVEEGTHEALIEKNGEYAKLWMMQAKAFLWFWARIRATLDSSFSLIVVHLLMVIDGTDVHSTNIHPQDT